MQREAAGWTDVHPVALQAITRGAVALVDCRTDPGSLQALREREAADAAADDEDTEGFGHLELPSRRHEMSGAQSLRSSAVVSPRGAFAANLWLRA